MKKMNKTTIWLSLSCLLIAALLLVSCTPAVFEEEELKTEEGVTLQVEGDIIVTSILDHGPGTLRQALLDAESGDIITFDPTVFPPGKPATIFLKTENGPHSLPNITQGNITIDASYTGVILDGSDISGDWVNGLEIYSDGNIIRGLQIINFTGSGIVVGGVYNEIGGDRGIGIGPFGQGNLVGKNGIGIDFCGSASFNTITGNLVGTDVTGTDGWGNEGQGLLIEEGCNHNTIGPSNIIAYNGGNGILITGQNSLNNTISQNRIYDNIEGDIYLWDGGNNELSAPTIVNFDLDNGTVTGSALANCTIEIFSDISNERVIYQGQTITDSSGSFVFKKGTSLASPHLTATATDADGNTSGFSIATSGTAGSTPLPTTPATAGRIAFASDRDGNFEIYVMDTDGSNQTRLTNNAADNKHPDWSPDGSRIAFRSELNWDEEIWVMDADGSNQIPLTNNPADDSHPAWAPDGSRIAFASDRDENDEIYVMDADGSNQTRLTNNSSIDRGPAWSPDGSRIAFWSDRDGSSEIYLMDADGSNQAHSTDPSVEGWFTHWSPDRSRYLQSSGQNGNDEIYVTDADGSNQTCLTNNSANDITPDWWP
ncbi:hypothetical protein ACFLVO_02065 [Chloroflexota bacterium]